jgi:leukotriene-A4 hydrolase
MQNNNSLTFNAMSALNLPKANRVAGKPSFSAVLSSGFSALLFALTLMSAPHAIAAAPVPAASIPAASVPAASIPAKTPAPLPQQQIDALTFANYQQVRLEHIELELTLDFNRHQIVGEALLSLNWQQHSGKLILDSRGLDIDSVWAVTPSGNTPLGFNMGTVHPVMGEAIIIETATAVPQIGIRYRSSTEASGLQWLSAEQTQGKQAPFMFSQNQAIHARSWLPLQDTPAVRTTFNAIIHAPKGIQVLMGAQRTPIDETTTRFEMPQAIPAYLFAIAAGKLDYKAFDDRSGVWAEPDMLDAAWQEFAETPHMIEIAERRFGPYRWQRYDLLVLPPSFPFGGMENPRLSFITPTVIAGDKSLVSLIAHELAHSWSGNLATNASWDDLWLNEGFTTYVENRIMEDLYGKARAQMELAIADDELRAELPTLDASDTALKLDLGRRDPDDAFSSVAYVKGQQFLRALEHTLGRDAFDKFLSGYFDHFAFKSVDTQGFIDYLLAAFPGEKARLEPLLTSWIFGHGLPESVPAIDRSAFVAIDNSIDAISGSQAHINGMQTSEWSTHHWLHFLHQLQLRPDASDSDRLKALDSRFKLSQSRNSEIAFAWYSLALARHYYQVKPELGQYLERIGRRRLVVPLYEQLAASEERPWAEAVFSRAKAGYHPMTTQSVERLFR